MEDQNNGVCGDSNVAEEIEKVQHQEKEIIECKGDQNHSEEQAEKDTNGPKVESEDEGVVDLPEDYEGSGDEKPVIQEPESAEVQVNDCVTEKKEEADDLEGEEVKEAKEEESVVESVNGGEPQEEQETNYQETHVNGTSTKEEENHIEEQLTKEEEENCKNKEKEAADTVDLKKEFSNNHDEDGPHSISELRSKWDSFGKEQSCPSIEHIHSTMADTAKSSRFGGAAEKCNQCQKTVYAMERLEVAGRLMHKTCFRCCKCNSPLSVGRFSVGGGELYCLTHYKQAFREKGTYDVFTPDNPIKGKWQSKPAE